MLLWIMTDDKAERMTRLKEYYLSKPQIRQFVAEQKVYHKRNGVKVKFKVFKNLELI